MIIGVVFFGITWARATSRDGGFRNVLKSWPGHYEHVIQPLRAAGHTVKVFVSTYEFPNDEIRRQFEDLVRPDGVVLAQYAGSAPVTTKYNCFQVLEKESGLDFIIHCRVDQHWSCNITDMNINFKKFNFFFKEVERRDGRDIMWWDIARFTTDHVWMYPGVMLHDVRRAVCETAAFGGRTDSHGLYNFLSKIIPEDSIHFIVDSHEKSLDNPYFYVCSPSCSCN
jgi:hypothetical protein